MPKSKTSKQQTDTVQEADLDQEVTVCRRRSDRRQAQDEAAATDAELAIPERRKVPRRRQIDPTTCERDYTADEIEFMHALDAYKRASGRMFPTCSEILEVVRNLGYEKIETEEIATSADEVSAETSA